jgi:FkbM family methyltransferase
MNKGQLKKVSILTLQIIAGTSAIAVLIFLFWSAIFDNLRCKNCMVLLKQTSAGFPILIDQRDQQDGLTILLNGEIKSGQDKLMSKILQPGSIAIDVGAGFGYYTIMMASLVKENGKVYAFEARNDVLKLLQYSVGMNFLRNVIIFNAPIYRKNQEVVAEFYDEDFNTSGIYELPIPDKQERGTSYLKTNAFSLDNILPNLKDVSLLRINNYGAEFEVLLGAVNIIKNSPQISIIIELNRSYLVNPQVAASVINNLYDMGFEFWHLENDGKKTLLTQDRLLSLNHADLLITKKGIY